MSYSALRHCKHNPLLLRHFCRCLGDTYSYELRLKLVCYFSSKKVAKTTSFTDQVTETLRRSKLEQALEALKVDAKTEKSALDARLGREATEELNEALSEELKATSIPPVIRCAIPSLLLNKTHSYSGGLHGISHESCAEVEKPLKTSKSFDDLCMLMAVPYDFAHGFSGITALLKLCQFTEKGDNSFGYTKHKAAYDELFSIVAQQLEQINAKSYLKIIQFKFSVDYFPIELSSKILSKFMIFMNEDKYSIRELLDFLECLQTHHRRDLPNPEKHHLDRVMRGVWNHVSLRPLKISPNMLAELYKRAPENHPRIWNALQNIFTESIDILGVKDIAVILEEACRRLHSTAEQNLVTTWLSKNNINLSVSDLEFLFSAFLQGDSVNRYFLEFLPKLLFRNEVQEHLTRKLVSQILTFCERENFFDEIVLEAACEHYVNDTDGYTAEQLGCLLRTIGLLNYTPCRQREFFTKVEDYLRENFYMIDVLSLLEMFVHVIFLDKIPVNFMDFIFAPLFLGIVNEMPAEDRVKGARFLQIIEETFRSRGIKPSLALPVDSASLAEGVDNSTHAEILPVLVDILGGKDLVLEKVRPTFSSHYLEMSLADIAKSTGFVDDLGENESGRLALLVMTPTSYRRNSNHLLGPELTNILLLQNRGLTVVAVNIGRLQYLNRQNKLYSFFYLLFEKILQNVVEGHLERQKPSPVTVMPPLEDEPSLTLTSDEKGEGQEEDLLIEVDDKPDSDYVDDIENGDSVLTR